MLFWVLVRIDVKKAPCNIRSYVIIDDLPEARFLEEQHPHLVWVQQEKGFAEKEAAIKAGKILDG